jgi:hypothetical protein
MNLCIDSSDDRFHCHKPVSDSIGLRLKILGGDSVSLGVSATLLSR